MALLKAAGEDHTIRVLSDFAGHSTCKARFVKEITSEQCYEQYYLRSGIVPDLFVKADRGKSLSVRSEPNVTPQSSRFPGL